MIRIHSYDKYKESEILSLYTSVGWTAYTDNPLRVQAAFANSLFTLAAWDDSKLVGIIRVVGDGNTVILIQDLLIYPEYQRRGIGSRLVRAVLAKYKTVYQIQLLTEINDKNISFYQAVGFQQVALRNCCALMKICYARKFG